MICAFDETVVYGPLSVMLKGYGPVDPNITDENFPLEAFERSGEQGPPFLHIMPFVGWNMKSEEVRKIMAKNGLPKESFRRATLREGLVAVMANSYLNEEKRKIVLLGSEWQNPENLETYVTYIQRREKSHGVHLRRIDNTWRGRCIFLGVSLGELPPGLFGSSLSS